MNKGRIECFISCKYYLASAVKTVRSFVFSIVFFLYSLSNVHAHTNLKKTDLESHYWLNKCDFVSNTRYTPICISLGKDLVTK